MSEGPEPRRGDPPRRAPVVPNGRGRFWTEHDWDNWRSRTFRSAAKAAGLPAGKDDGPARVRPRDLRSSFATLLIYEGQPPQYVADQLGNSPGTLLHRAHSRPLRSRRHRAQLNAGSAASPSLAGASVFHRCFMAPRPKPLAMTKALEREKPSVGLEPTTPSLPWKCSTN